MYNDWLVIGQKDNTVVPMMWSYCASPIGQSGQLYRYARGTFSMVLSFLRGGGGYILYREFSGLLDK